MLTRHFTVLAFVSAIAWFLVPAVRAQDGATRIGICNPGKVWETMDERKAMEEKLRTDQLGIENEAKKRKGEVDELRSQLNQLNTNTAAYQEKNKQWTEKALEFEVWARLKQNEMQRVQKEQIKALFQKIEDATKEIAEEKKLDLVLAERRPEIPENMDAMTADEVRARINQRDVLYKNANADITDAVVARVNQRYHQRMGGAAPAPAAAPAPK